MLNGGGEQSGDVFSFGGSPGSATQISDVPTSTTYNNESSKGDLADASDKNQGADESSGSKSSSSSPRKKDVPDQAAPGEVKIGAKRTREYDSNGQPLRDYDKPHQGYQKPHVHEWSNGEREHPGRDYSPWPRQ